MHMTFFCNTLSNLDSASPVRDTNPIRFSIYDLDLNSTMNGPVREKLGIIPDGHYWDGTQIYTAIQP